MLVILYDSFESIIGFIIHTKWKIKAYSMSTWWSGVHVGCCNCSIFCSLINESFNFWIWINILLWQTFAIETLLEFKISEIKTGSETGSNSFWTFLIFILPDPKPLFRKGFYIEQIFDHLIIDFQHRYLNLVIIFRIRTFHWFILSTISITSVVYKN